MNTYAIEFPFTMIRPSVVDDLDLPRYGLKWTSPDPHNTYLSPDGASWSMYHDLRRTCESIARLSRRDAAYYERWMQALMDIAYAMIPYLMDHPRPSPRTIASLARRAAKGRKSLLAGARLLLSSPLDIIDGLREELKAFFAMNVATGSFRPLDEPANTSILVYFAILHLVPLQRPVGGAGAFADALAACAKASGGEIRTSAPVQQIVVHNGKATGVVLQNGEQLHAEQVVAAVDPTSLFTRLLDSSAVPSPVQDEVSRMRVQSSGVSHFKADIAVTRRPSFPRHSVTDDQLAGLSFAPSVDYVERLMAAIKRGELAAEIPFYIAVPSVLDRTLVPPGSDGDSIFVWVGAVPDAFSDGREWADLKSAYVEKVIDHLEEYSPGVRDSIIGVNTSGPRDFNEPWAYKGSARGVDLIPSQMGPWRPSPLLSGYKTPIDGLWHSGHGAHPMSGTSGWPGRTTARTMLKRSRSVTRRRRFATEAATSSTASA
jgi:beta-carotene ketolase (CrtO type)